MDLNHSIIGRVERLIKQNDDYVVYYCHVGGLSVTIQMCDANWDSYNGSIKEGDLLFITGEISLLNFPAGKIVPHLFSVALGVRKIVDGRPRPL